MMSKSFNPDEMLTRAIEQFRMTPASRAAMERCIGAMSAQRPLGLSARARLRWTLRLVAAAAVAGAAGTVVFFPRQASALESLQEVLNTQNPHLFQHTKQYVVSPDGRRLLTTEFYTAPGLCRINLPDGNKQLQEKNGDYTVMFPTGDVKIFHHHPGGVIPTVNVKQVIGQGGGAAYRTQSVTVDRGATLSGKKVDRYRVRGTYSDAHYKGKAYSFTLDADPATKRPLRVLGGFEGMPQLESDFDYPAYSAKYFKLPITAKTHVVDEGDWATYRSKHP